MVDDTDDPRLELLLEQILESGESPEEACRSCPELLSKVRMGLWQLRQLDEEVSGLFPPSNPDDAEPSLSIPKELPVVPGYEVLGVIGHGGMGILFRARHLRLKRLVAMKMILGGGLALPAQRQRFVREAESIADISHPNIVQVHNAGECDGRPWFTMELVTGGTLAQRINGAPQPVDQSAELVATLAEAMAVAHGHGVLHRDLKPSNILLTPDGTPKVTDFGLARWLNDPGTTHGEVPLGTPSYMAPEQARAEKQLIGPATDVYGLGAILYELLTGRAPFRAESSTATLQQLLSHEPVPPARLNPRVRRDLETICLKCLQKEPSKRYESTAALADDLRRFLRHEPIHARRVGLTGRLARWARRHPGTASMTGALVLTALIAVSLIVRQWRVAENARAEANRMATHLVLDRGITLCERGDIAPGLLWFARGLEQAERSGETDLIPALRTNLSAWSERLVVPRVSPPFGAAVMAVAFHPDGRRLLVARWGNADGQPGPGEARVVDADTFAPVGPPLPHPEGIRSAVFSPDGKRILTAGRDGTVRLWDSESGKALGDPLELGGAFLEVAFAPDGQSFATANSTHTSGEVRVWDVASGQPVTPVMAHQGMVHCLAFSPDGKTLLTGCGPIKRKDQIIGGEARLWDSHTGLEVGPVLAHSGVVTTVSFSPDGQTVLTGTSDGLLRRRRRGTWGTISPPLHHFAPLRAAVFSLDGRSIISGDGVGNRPNEREAAVRLWDSDSGSLLAGPWIHPAAVSSIAWSPEGRRFATGCEDGHVRLFPLGAYQPQRWHYLDGIQSTALYGAQTTDVIAMGDVVTTFSPDGRKLLVGGDTPQGQEAAHLVDVLTGNIQDFVQGRRIETSQTVGVGFSVDGQIAVTTSDDGTLRLWNPQNATLLKGPRTYGEKTIPWMMLFPDAHTLVTGARGHPIEVWDRDTGKRIAGPIVGDAFVQAMTLSADGKTLATAGDGGVVQLWDVRTGQLRSRFSAVKQTIWSLRFSPDATSLLAGGQDAAWLFKVSTGTLLCPPMPHAGRVWEAKFSSDGGRLLTVCSDDYRDQNPGTARMWNARTGEPLGPPFPHRIAGLAAAISPDGRLAATGGYDGDVRFWDAATGAPVGPALIQSGPIPAVAFVSGTKLLAAAGKNGELVLWPVPEARHGDPTEIRHWVQSITGQKLQEIGAVPNRQP